MRIVSLLPSATEIVAHLGLLDSLVGISHDCDWPSEVRDKPVVSETVLDPNQSSQKIDDAVKEQVHTGRSVYHLDQELLDELNPDLILTQELCEVCAPSYDSVDTAAKIVDGETKVVSLEPQTLEGILENIRTVGELTGVHTKTGDLLDRLNARIEKISSKCSDKNAFNVISIEWISPPYVGGHWVPEMVELAGGTDYNDPGQHSFEVQWSEIIEYDPKYIVFMPCGFKLDRTKQETKSALSSSLQKELSAVNENRSFAVNGSHYFNRPGPRIVTGLEILAKLFHPSTFDSVEVPENSYCNVFGSVG